MGSVVPASRQESPILGALCSYRSVASTASSPTLESASAAGCSGHPASHKCGSVRCLAETAGQSLAAWHLWEPVEAAHHQAAPHSASHPLLHVFHEEVDIMRRRLRLRWRTYRPLECVWLFASSEDEWNHGSQCRRGGPRKQESRTFAFSDSITSQVSIIFSSKSRTIKNPADAKQRK